MPYLFSKKHLLGNSLKIVLLLFAVNSQTVRSSEAQPPITTSSYEVVLNELKKRGFNGTVLMTREGQEVFARSIGVVDANTGEALNPNSRIPIGSVTKTLVATVILQLVEEGQLELDGDISRFFPDISWSKEVTPRQLLAHTAGIPNYTDAEGFWTWVSDNPAATPNDLVNLFKNLVLEFTPGEKHAYSNSGYVLLGLIIEELTGLEFSEALEQRLFVPLEMADSAYEADFDGSNATMPHLKEGPELIRTEPYNMRWAYAAGGVVSTVRDLSKFNAAMNAGRLLSPELQVQMETPVHDGYGLGIMTRNLDDEKVLWHTGGLPHYIAYNIHIPNKNTSIIVLTNTFSLDLRNLLAHALLEIELEGETTLPAYRPYVEASKDVTDVYVGNYYSEEIGLGASVFYNEAGRLRIRVAQQQDLGLYPYSPTDFEVGLVSAVVRFSEGGSSFTLFQHGRAFVFNRVETL